MEDYISYGAFTEGAARALVYSYAPKDIVDFGHAWYGSDEDLKSLDGHDFYKIMMDAKNGTLTDLFGDDTMSDNGASYAAWLLFDHYKGVIWAVMKKFLLGEQRTAKTTALKKDQSEDYLLKVYQMLAGKPSKEEGIPDVYTSFKPEAVNWNCERGFGYRLARSGDLVGYLSQIAIRIWKKDAKSGANDLSLEGFTTNDEGEDNSDRNAALATEDFSDKVLVNTIFDNFIKKALNGETGLRKTTIDIFIHARPFFNTPKDSNHMIYAKAKKLLNTEVAKEIVAKSLASGKTRSQALADRRNYLIALAFETELKSYAKYNRALTAKSLIADESIPFEAHMVNGRPSQAEGFRLGYYGFPTRYRDDCETEEQKEQWDAAYKKLLKDISWRMSNDALLYIKKHPEDFNVLTESEKRIIAIYDAIRIIESYKRDLRKGRTSSLKRVFEAVNATGLQSLREATAKISLDLFTEHLSERNTAHAAIVDLMREYPDNEAAIQECLNLSNDTYKAEVESIKKEFKEFLK